MDNLAAVPSRVAQLAAAFSRPEPIRRGSLYERRMKCGQAACACQHDPQAAHGPYFTLTQKVEGKTRSLGGKSNRGGNFENASKPIGRPASAGPMNNSKRSWPPPRRLKKRALRGPGKRNRPGNQSALRSSGGCRTGFRGRRDGRAAPSFATRRPRSGTTAQRRQQRSCRTGIALSLRRLRPVSWPSPEDLRKRPGSSPPGAGLLSL